MSEPDEEKLIYDWTDGISVPTWAVASPHSECHHCHSPLKKGHMHNCRLCGDLYCSQCTLKLHIKSMYNIKGKPGPERVCFACRDKCLFKKQQAQAESEGRERTLTSFNRDQSKIFIPVWDDMNDYEDCMKCAKKMRHKYHCRACGKMYCSQCTQKMDIPRAFEKKNKDGPARVCDSCRFLLIKGAQWVPESKPDEEKVLGTFRKINAGVSLKANPHAERLTGLPPPIDGDKPAEDEDDSAARAILSRAKMKKKAEEDVQAQMSDSEDEDAAAKAELARSLVSSAKGGISALMDSEGTPAGATGEPDAEDEVEDGSEAASAAARVLARAQAQAQAQLEAEEANNQAEAAEAEAESPAQAQAEAEAAAAAEAEAAAQAEAAAAAAASAAAEEAEVPGDDPPPAPEEPEPEPEETSPPPRAEKPEAGAVLGFAPASLAATAGAILPCESCGCSSFKASARNSHVCQSCLHPHPVVGNQHQPGEDNTDARSDTEEVVATPEELSVLPPAIAAIKAKQKAATPAVSKPAPSVAKPPPASTPILSKQPTAPSSSSSSSSSSPALVKAPSAALAPASAPVSKPKAVVSPPPPVAAAPPTHASTNSSISSEEMEEKSRALAAATASPGKKAPPMPKSKPPPMPASKPPPIPGERAVSPGPALPQVSAPTPTPAPPASAPVSERAQSPPPQSTAQLTRVASPTPSRPQPAATSPPPTPAPSSSSSAPAHAHKKTAEVLPTLAKQNTKVALSPSSAVSPPKQRVEVAPPAAAVVAAPAETSGDEGEQEGDAPAPTPAPAPAPAHDDKKPKFGVAMSGLGAMPVTKNVGKPLKCDTCGCVKFKPFNFKPGHCNTCFHKHPFDESAASPSQDSDESTHVEKEPIRAQSPPVVAKKPQNPSDESRAKSPPVASPPVATAPVVENLPDNTPAQAQAPSASLGPVSSSGRKLPPGAVPMGGLGSRPITSPPRAMSPAAATSSPPPAASALSTASSSSSSSSSSSATSPAASGRGVGLVKESDFGPCNNCGCIAFKRHPFSKTTCATCRHDHPLLSATPAHTQEPVEEDYPRKIFVNPFGSVADSGGENQDEAENEEEEVKQAPVARAPPGAKPPAARPPPGAKPPAARKEAPANPPPTPAVVAPTSPPPAAKPTPPAAVRSPVVSPAVSPSSTPAKERPADGPGRKCDQCNCPAFKKNPFKKGQCAKCFHDHE